MVIHIATSDSYMAGAIPMRFTCPVCLSETDGELGWIDARCGDCGALSSTDSPNRTVRLRRERLGLTRDEMAGKLGIKRSTVTRYEARWPSRRYWDATREMVAQTKC